NKVLLRKPIGSFDLLLRNYFLTWQTLLFQETLARTFVFGYCSVFKVLPAVFDDLYSILHLFDLVNYFFHLFNGFFQLSTAFNRLRRLSLSY
ncbi:hypothetical protein, partial [Phascolarctobacterium faecium]|uniref:hypothetical protein n=1 Tax=Phascolarctobacterium faecium TaxID=33025 RepID=UPI00242CF4D2